MTDAKALPQIRLDPWTDDDLPLLLSANTPEMTRHLGGPEPEAKVLARHQRFLDGWRSTTPRMFRIGQEPGGEPVGSVGYWARVWRDEEILEAGWNILAPWQGRGLATAAIAAMVNLARRDRPDAHLHAFPAVSNSASNAVCRRVGFTLIGESDFEYPKGSLMRCNDWMLDLSDAATTPPS